MALTNIQALEVVVGCVHGVSGRKPTPTQTLKTGGITDEDRLAAFVSLVVTDAALGVGRFQHGIEADALGGLSVDDTVQDTADVVRANAVPRPARRSKRAASRVAPAKGTSRKRAGKRGGK